MVTESTVLLELLVSCDGGRGPTHAYKKSKSLIFATVACRDDGLGRLTVVIKKLNISVIFIVIRKAKNVK